MSTELNLYLIFVLITLLIMVPAFISMFRRNWVQALVKCGFFLLSLTIAFILTLTITPSIENGVVTTLSNVDDQTMQQIAQYLQSDAEAAKTLLNVVAAMVSPLLFWLYFLGSMLIFQIVYLILNNLLLKKIMIENQTARVISRIATATLFFVRGYAYLCVLLMPFSYYLSLTNDCLANETIAETVKSGNQITDTTISDLKVIENNIFVKIYSVPNSWYIPTLTNVTSGEYQSTIEEMVPQTLEIVSALTSLSGKDVSEIDVSVLIDAANKVEEAPVIDSFAGSFLSDAGSSWNEGNAFLAIEPIKLDEENTILNTTLYKILINNDLASTELKAVSAMLATYYCLFGNNSGSASTLAEAIKYLDEDSLEILKEVTSGEVLSSLLGFANEEQGNLLSNVISSLFDEVYSLVPGEDASQEKTDKYYDEVGKIDDLLKTVGSDDMSDSETLGRVVNDIATSDVILNAVADNITEENTNTLMESFGAEIPDATSQLIYNLVDNMQDTDSEERGEQAEYVTEAVVEMTSTNPDTGKTLKDICLSPIATASSVSMINEPTQRDDFFYSLYLSYYPLAQNIVDDSLNALQVSNLNPNKADETKEKIRQLTGDALSSVVNSIKAGTSDKETLLSLAEDSDIVTDAIDDNL